jgi:hypothetical protein
VDRLVGRRRAGWDGYACRLSSEAWQRRTTGVCQRDEGGAVGDSALSHAVKNQAAVVAANIGVKTFSVPMVAAFSNASLHAPVHCITGACRPPKLLKPRYNVTACPQSTCTTTPRYTSGDDNNDFQNNNDSEPKQLAPNDLTDLIVP